MKLSSLFVIFSCLTLGTFTQASPLLTKTLAEDVETAIKELDIDLRSIQVNSTQILEAIDDFSLKVQDVLIKYAVDVASHIIEVNQIADKLKEDAASAGVNITSCIDPWDVLVNKSNVDGFKLIDESISHYNNFHMQTWFTISSQIVHSVKAIDELALAAWACNNDDEECLEGVLKGVADLRVYIEQDLLDQVNAEIYLAPEHAKRVIDEGFGAIDGILGSMDEATDQLKICVDDLISQ